MENEVNIVWFKRDLRVYDHKPLSEACHNGYVYSIYIFEPEFWKLPDSSLRHWSFIYDSLIELKEELSKIGLILSVYTGEVLKILENIRQEKITSKITLYSHEETGNNWTYNRDLKVKEWCEYHKIAWKEYQSNGVVRRLKNRDIWERLRDNYMNENLISLPVNSKQSKIKEVFNIPLKNHSMFGSDSFKQVQKGGRLEGMKITSSFVKERAEKYMHNISKPGISARSCSRLSPHITFGTLSVREIIKVTNLKIKSLSLNSDKNSKYFSNNLVAFLSRLAWHCHFIQKLEQRPDIEYKCIHSSFEGMREPFHNEDLFLAWKEGRTGYPLIDACMRSLHENGWITFRMRALLVSFASYNLWLDWRITAPHLAKLFTDYEPGIHYPQFQMQSGTTGINTLRIYNPVKQSYDQDPDSKFIKRYIPELKELSNLYIHEPWKNPGKISNYPAPVVDTDKTLKFARIEISKIIKSDGFKEISKAVYEKLGSRKSNTVKLKRTRKKSGNSDQLTLKI